MATDADWVFNEVDAALGGAETVIERVHAGAEVRAAVRDSEPDLVVLDLQIGNMGGMAASIDLRHEEEADRIKETAVLMLLDRDADVWLANQALADGWLIKPLDPIRLSMAAEALLAGESYTEGLDNEAPETPTG